ncbi:MAG: hypothetical protein APF76_01200 [Desulfitibacter sp. BRH_c19]|nr:MAG: hypothetical protein APF76_01200 [Desulfitibacter sp. BRH_c19]
MPTVKWYSSLGLQRKSCSIKIQKSKGMSEPQLDKQSNQENLILSKALFSKTFHNNPNLLFISNIDGKLIDVNKAAINSTGYTRDEFLKMSDIQKNFCIVKEDSHTQSVSDDGKTGNKWVTFQTKAGEIKKGILTVENIDINGNIYVLQEIVDITGKNKFNQEMEHLDRLSIVGKMAASIAHEVRNPLTTVRGFLQLLQKKEDCSPYMDYFKIMIDEIDRANLIISEFLSFAGNKNKPSSKGNLKNIIENLLPLLYANSTQDGKDINSKLLDVPNILLDQSEVRQLVLNLVRNGLEAMNKGGTLTVNTYAENSYVVLSIIDEGPGFSKEALDNLGNPFFTTKDKGTGLGLSICYSIARRHNAIIEIDSIPGKTNIMVKFPILDQL